MSFDFATHGDYWLALLPEIVLALTAMVVLLGDAFRTAPGERSGWIASASLAGLAAALILTLRMAGATGTSDALIAVDGFRVIADVILLVGTGLIVVVAGGYLEREDLPSGDFHGLLLLATVGTMVLVAARDTVLLFVGLELMSIAVYVLTGYARRDPRSSEAGLKYFLVGAFASAFLLYGIALLYGVTGTTRLGGIGDAVAAGVAAGDPILTAGLGLLLIGFAFKVAAVPFHMWTPDAYDGAPTPITAYMATGVKAAAFVALLRLFTVDLLGAAEIWRSAVWWLAILTMIVPNLIALAQDSVKRMLAYSSIAHAGYLLVGVVAASELGRSASLFYLAAYTLMTVGSFAVVWHVAGKGDRHALIDDYRGLGWRRPGLAAAMLVFLLSLAGFPPTAGFVGKLYLLQAAVEAGEVALAVTLVMTSLVAYYYYLRVVWKMYFDQAAADQDVPGPARGRFGLVTGVCAALLLVGGLFPGRVIDGVGDAVAGGAAELPPPTAPVAAVVDDADVPPAVR